MKDSYEYLTDYDAGYIKNNRCKASEVRKITKETVEKEDRDKIKTALSAIFGIIMRQAEMGFDECCVMYHRVIGYDKKYNNDVKKILEEMGYKVNLFNSLQSLTISWHDGEDK